MTKTAAVTISEVIGSRITNDGEHALIKAAQPNATEITLAVPSAELFKFIDSFALSAAQAGGKNARFKGLTQVFATSWFELATDKATGSIILSLTFGAGGTLSFRLSRSMAEQIRETLDVQLGGTNLQTLSTPRH